MWNRARRVAGLGCLGGLLLLQACQGPPAAEGTAPPAPPPERTAAEPGAEAGAGAAPGLVPLPSRAQVVDAVALGRTNPFGPLARPVLPQAPPAAGTTGKGGGTAGSGKARAAAAVRLKLPETFRFSGVIASAGRSEAVVQYGDRSGSVRTGDLGGRTTDLLPRGWTVAAIDVSRGHLTLRHDGQQIRAEL